MYWPTRPTEPFDNYISFSYVDHESEHDCGCTISFKQIDDGTWQTDFSFCVEHSKTLGAALERFQAGDFVNA